MRGYSAREIFDVEAHGLFRKATRLVHAIPEGMWRCHEVARAVLRFMPSRMKVVDGLYAAVDHSWLVGDARLPIVLDVYSVGQLPMVQLVDAHTPGGTPYRPGSYRSDIRRDDIAEMIRAMTAAEEGRRMSTLDTAPTF